MFITPLNINQVLDRFYNQSKYDLMLLFVSSFDGNDRAILKEIVDNAKRIDRITGDRICFFYFIKDAFDSMNESLTRWVKNISDWEPLYGEGVSVTMETADDICRHFGILRSNFPAFILVGKHEWDDPQVFSIREYNDFESFLTPLNILHAYVDDRSLIISRYESEKRRGVITQKQVDERNEQRHSWIIALERLKKKKAKELLLGLTDKANEREIEIQKFHDKLADYPEMKLQGEDESVVYPQQELDLIKEKSIERLNISLNTNDGERLIDNLANERGYLNTVLKIWELAKARGVRVSRIIENIRYQIHEHGFDVFISCKSQDYALAHELYDYLVNNGFKPFLADTSIKEVGIDQYTALIGEVINVCQNMIVFATDPDYIETPYVAAEWHTFVNDINTGHKPNAKLVNILAPNIDVHNLPAWLRDKQCFTTESYKDNLLNFLYYEKIDSHYIYDIKERIHDLQYEIKDKLFVVLQEYPDWGPYNRNDIILWRDTTLAELYTFEIELDKVTSIKQIVRLDFEFGEKERRIREQIDHLTSRTYACPSNSSIFEGVLNLALSPLNIVLRGINAITNLAKNPISKTDNTITTYKPQPRNVNSTSVYSSIFAPAEVKRISHMFVQVYLHLCDETEKVSFLAVESDKNAERRDYIPLQCKLKKGDKVDVLLNVYGETLLMSDKKSVIWQGSFTKCSFEYFVSKDIDVEDLSCVALLTVNEIPVGEMRFITRIVESPRKLNPEIIAHKYNKVFISYAHKDEAKVKSFHEGLKLAGIEHFFDRAYLKTGDIFPQVIQDYINSADLFVLFWSENASKSEYVQKERTQALKRAFPQVKPQQKAKLSIYPMSIEPRAELPYDMKDNYHFGEI